MNFLGFFDRSQIFLNGVLDLLVVLYEPAVVNTHSLHSLSVLILPVIGLRLGANRKLRKLLHVLQAEVSLFALCTAVQALLLRQRNEDLTSTVDKLAHHQYQISHEELVMPGVLSLAHIILFL